MRLADGPGVIKLEDVKTLTVISYPGGTGCWLVAFNPETVTTRPGKRVEQALRNPKDGLGLYLAEPPAPVWPGAILTTLKVEHG